MRSILNMILIVFRKCSAKWRLVDTLDLKEWVWD